MYRPETRIIDSGYANIKFNPPDMDYEGWKEIGEKYLAQQEKKYKETEDLYDLQNQEAQQLNEVLEGTSGKDYQYLQESIVNARNELKELYKGKRAKETKTPEFQGKLYDIRQSLLNKRNGIDTFHQQAKQATDIAMNTPSIKKREWNEYLMKQAELPPDMRDKNLIAKINTDPLFFNPYDYTSNIIGKLGKSDEQVEVENEDTILNYDVTYRPDLGAIDKKTGQFKFAPSDTLIDQLFAQDPRFYNAMAGMIPAEEAKKYIDEGNSTDFHKTVREQAKKYIEAVKGFGPEFKQTGKTTKTWKYYKPSAADTKAKKEDEEVMAIQQRLLNKDARSFNDYIGDFWRAFDYEYDGDDNIVGVIATYQEKHPRVKGKMIDKHEFIDVDPDDSGSVKQALNRIKYFSNRDKKQVTAKPLQQQEKGKEPKGFVDDIE